MSINGPLSLARLSMAFALVAFFIPQTRGLQQPFQPVETARVVQKRQGCLADFYSCSDFGGAAFDGVCCQNGQTCKPCLESSAGAPAPLSAPNTGRTLTAHRPVGHQQQPCMLSEEVSCRRRTAPRDVRTETNKLNQRHLHRRSSRQLPATESNDRLCPQPLLLIPLHCHLVRQCPSLLPSHWPVQRQL